MRTIRRNANGSATVSLVVRERPWSAVVADMVDGFVAVNEASPARKEELRDLLWATVEHIELRDEAGSSAGGRAGLQVVSPAA